MIDKDVDTDGDNDIDRGERYVYDPNGGLDPVIFVFDETGALLTRTLNGSAVDQVFAAEHAAGDVLWALTDHQGSVRDLAEYDAVSGDTEIVNHIQYSAFGTVVSEIDPDTSATPPIRTTASPPSARGTRAVSGTPTPNSSTTAPAGTTRRWEGSSTKTRSAS